MLPKRRFWMGVTKDETNVFDVLFYGVSTWFGLRVINSRKSTFHLWFIFPKSSFGENEIVRFQNPLLNEKMSIREYSHLGRKLRIFEIILSWPFQLRSFVRYMDSYTPPTLLGLKVMKGAYKMSWPNIFRREEIFVWEATPPPAPSTSSAAPTLWRAKKSHFRASEENGKKNVDKMRR